jgi:hypothetical protein
MTMATPKEDRVDRSLTPEELAEVIDYVVGEQRAGRLRYV